MKKLMMAVMVAAIGLSAAAAYTPSFAYQGVLRDQWGNPLGSDQENVKITFKIYKSSNGNDYLWSKVYTVSLATNGLFNVELNGAGTSSAGASTTLDKVAADNSNEDLYIGLTVADSAGEITPRQKLIPAPRAIFAQDVKTAQGDLTVKGDLTVAGAISMSDSSNTLSVANIWATGTLYAEKQAILHSGLQIEGGKNSTNLTVAGSASVSGNLFVDGSAVSMPIGAIMMWSGSASANDLPRGGCWKLCDGDGTYAFNGDSTDMRPIPDLRGRFIVAAVGDGSTKVTIEGEDVQYKTGDTGGKNSVTLTVDTMPNHRHTYIGDDSIKVDDKYAHPTNKGYSGDMNSNYDVDSIQTYQDEAVGGGKAHENRPPYYALCFIIKVK